MGTYKVRPKGSSLFKFEFFRKIYYNIYIR